MSKRERVKRVRPKSPSVLSVDPVHISSLIREGWADMKAEEETAERKAREPKTVGICLVCTGKVQEDRVVQFVDHHRHAIIGPGSADQYATVSNGFYCETCGIKYQFPPPKRKKEGPSV